MKKRLALILEKLPKKEPATREEALLLVVIAELVAYIEELEERLGLDSANSSRPPSSDFVKPGSAGDAGARASTEATSSKEEPRKRGGRPGHNGHGRRPLPPEQVERIEEHLPPEHCECGGRVIPDGKPYRTRQVFELPKPHVETLEHRSYGGTCECCGRRHFGIPPETQSYGMFGPRLTALIVSLYAKYRMSVDLVRECLYDVYGISVSGGAVCALLARAGKKLEPVREEILARVREADMLNVDETGGRTCGKRTWIWGASAPGAGVATFVFGESRGREAFERLVGGPPEAQGGNGPIISTDRYSAYSRIPPMRHQLCWAHLLRDFRRLAERNGQEGAIGRRLLAEAERLFSLWKRKQAGELPDVEWKSAMTELKERVRITLEEGSVLPRRRRNGETSTRGTCRELLGHFESLWVFVAHSEVEPTNNEAERRLRKVVLYRKISYGTQSGQGDRFLETLFTIIETCRMQARSVLCFLEDALTAALNMLPIPRLVGGG